MIPSDMVIYPALVISPVSEEEKIEEGEARWTSEVMLGKEDERDWKRVPSWARYVWEMGEVEWRVCVRMAELWPGVENVRSQCSSLTIETYHGYHSVLLQMGI